MTDNNENEEVKEFTQTVRIAPSSKEEEAEDESESEETETPSSSSDEEKEPEPDETEEEAEESAETEEEPEPEAETPKPEPKPVEGETPREKALRLETARLKGLLRAERRDELFVQKPTESKPSEEDLAEYDPEEVKRFEKLARAMGFAKKDEINQETTQEKLNTEFELFIEAHPEYSPENDPDGTLWNQVKAEFALYTPPKDPKTLKKVLNKVHKEIFGVQPAANLSKINASREKIKVASHTGASAGKATTRVRPQPPSGLRLDALKGFDDKEKEELFS